MSAAATRGFTLLELLVVMLVMGLLAATAVAVYPRILPGLDARQAARELAAGLRYARSRAMTEYREVAVTLDVEAGSFTVGAEGPPRRLPERLGIKLTAARAEQAAPGVGAIRFFPDGSSTGGGIRLEAGSESYHVSVDWLTGRVEIVE